MFYHVIMAYDGDRRSSVVKHLLFKPVGVGLSPAVLVRELVLL